MDLLEHINHNGTTIVMVTHDPELSRRAHRNIQLLDGQVSALQPFDTPRPAADVAAAPTVA
ncbi:MAG: ABC transporter ATP-binding protein, partial [Pseudomonadota bacterium]